MKPSVWEFLHQKLRRGIPTQLLVVVECQGYSPGKVGFKMAVAADGESCGSIGGGVMEHRMVEKTRERLASSIQQPLIVSQIHEGEEGVDASGMICGGRQTLLFYPCQEKDLDTIVSIQESISQNRAGLLTISEEKMSFRSKHISEQYASFKRASSHRFIYREHLPQRDTVYIFGGGHVALALSQILSLLDLRIVVLDERPELEDMYADIKIVAPFEHATDYLKPPQHDAKTFWTKTYAVIMTPSHVADETVLRGLIDKPLRYIGMMASPRKAQEILQHLRQQGVAEELLQRVHTPIGLPIFSHTPAEIAVSIAAEIIRERNQDLDKKSRFKKTIKTESETSFGGSQATRNL